jgi:hypothetical protein
MSQNESTAAGQPEEKTGAGEALGQSMQAYAAELLRECKQVGPDGNERMLIPLAQLYIDVRMVEMKLQALYEEAADLIDSPKVLARLMGKLGAETRRLKSVNDSRPKVAVAQGVLAGVNGRNRG